MNENKQVSGPLTIEQALDNVTLACRAFQGNREQHHILDSSLQLLREMLMKAAQKSEE